MATINASMIDGLVKKAVDHFKKPSTVQRLEDEQKVKEVQMLIRHYENAALKEGAFQATLEEFAQEYKKPTPEEKMKDLLMIHTKPKTIPYSGSQNVIIGKSAGLTYNEYNVAIGYNAKGD